MENQNQNDPENQNQRQPGNRNQNENQGPSASRNQGGMENQNQNENQAGMENRNQGPSASRNQGGMENQNQPQNNIGQWQAWTQPEGNVTHLHVTGTIPTDAKNQNFTLKPAASQGTSKSLILELDHHEGINAKGKETASIREFDLPLGAQKYDSVIIRSKGTNNVATIPINLRNPKA